MSNGFYRRPSGILFALILPMLAVGVMLLISRTEAAPALIAITVNSVADVVADDGLCTLREAITAANRDAASGSPACSAGRTRNLRLACLFRRPLNEILRSAQEARRKFYPERDPSLRSGGEAQILPRMN